MIFKQNTNPLIYNLNYKRRNISQLVQMQYFDFDKLSIDSVNQRRKFLQDSSEKTKQTRFQAQMKSNFKFQNLQNNRSELLACVGMLRINWYNDEGYLQTINYGTAFAVSQRIIITCTHNIYSQKRKQFCTEVLFFPNLNKQKIQNLSKYKSAKTQEAQSFFRCQQPKKSFNYQPLEEQLTLIVLQSPLESGSFINAGTIGKEQQNKNKKLQIIGYPSKQYYQQPDLNLVKAHRKELSGNLYDVSGHIIKHTMKTSIGMSGSPILALNDQNQYMAVGIHTHRGLDSNYNCGLFFHSKIIRQIQQFQMRLKFVYKLHSSINYIQQDNRSDQSSLQTMRNLIENFAFLQSSYSQSEICYERTSQKNQSFESNYSFDQYSKQSSFCRDHLDFSQKDQQNNSQILKPCSQDSLISTQSQKSTEISTHLQSYPQSLNMKLPYLNIEPIQSVQENYQDDSLQDVLQQIQQTSNFFSKQGENLNILTDDNMVLCDILQQIYDSFETAGESQAVSSIINQFQNESLQQNPILERMTNKFSLRSHQNIQIIQNDSFGKTKSKNTNIYKKIRKKMIFLLILNELTVFNLSLRIQLSQLTNMPEPFSVALGSILTLTVYKIARVCYRLAPYFVKHSLEPCSPAQYQFVIVTGATDGIGFQFVRWLVAHNYRVLAIGRNQSKLAQLHKTSDKIFTQQVDFSQTYQQHQIISQVLDNINKNLPSLFNQQSRFIKGIVNCAGISHFSKYQNLSIDQINKLHRVNIDTLNLLLQLNKKLAAQKNQNAKPFFINVSSAVAHSPHKYSSVYSATKAYMSNLIEAVSKEQPAVTYLDIRPWYVKTKIVGYLNTWDTVQPKQIAEGSFRLLGKRSWGTGCWKHELIHQFEWILKSRMEARLEQMMARVDRINKLRNKKK